jgi:hypothetical protein
MASDPKGWSAFATRSKSSANTDAPIFNNPKRACDGLLREEIQHAPDSSLDCDMCLVGKPKHDNASELGRRVSEDIGKVQVQSDERTLLATAHVDDAFVWLTTEGLLNDGMSLVPIGHKQRRQ